MDRVRSNKTEENKRHIINVYKTRGFIKGKGKFVPVL
jgi:hypothetical protein